MILHDLKRSLQCNENHKNSVEALGDYAPSKATIASMHSSLVDGHWKMKLIQVLATLKNATLPPE